MPIPPATAAVPALTIEPSVYSHRPRPSGGIVLGSTTDGKTCRAKSSDAQSGPSTSNKRSAMSTRASGSELSGRNSRSTLLWTTRSAQSAVVVVVVAVTCAAAFACWARRHRHSSGHRCCCHRCRHRRRCPRRADRALACVPDRRVRNPLPGGCDSRWFAPRTNALQHAHVVPQSSAVSPRAAPPARCHGAHGTRASRTACEWMPPSAIATCPPADEYSPGSTAVHNRRAATRRCTDACRGMHVGRASASRGCMMAHQWSMAARVRTAPPLTAGPKPNRQLRPTRAARA
ncbi:hypothetical protein BC828DRAFT_394509, partial [Blastocladiella britannica]